MNAALLIIDMFNAFDFRGAQALLAAARSIADPIDGLRHQARAADVPVIFVNDNYGRWHDERSDLLAHLGRPGAPGAALVERLRPRDDEYFVIKPESSGFYATVLPALLPRLGVSRLILTGIAADMCVLFTAADAHMREYPLWVPADAVAAETPEQAASALRSIAENMRAETAPTTALRLTDWADRDEEARRRRQS